MTEKQLKAVRREQSQVRKLKISIFYWEMFFIAMRISKFPVGGY